jgi:hypothetical protein
MGKSFQFVQIIIKFLMKLAFSLSQLLDILYFPYQEYFATTGHFVFYLIVK